MLSRFVKRDWKNLMRNKRDIIEGKRLRDHYKLDHVYKSVEELYDFEKSLVGAMAEHEWEMEKKKREWAKKDALFRRAKTAWEQEALRDLAGDKVDTEQGKVGTQVAFGVPYFMLWRSGMWLWLFCVAGVGEEPAARGQSGPDTALGWPGRGRVPQVESGEPVLRR